MSLSKPDSKFHKILKKIRQKVEKARKNPTGCWVLLADLITLHSHNITKYIIKSIKHYLNRWTCRDSNSVALSYQVKPATCQAHLI
jgi:hypothetical protein